jgi:hypothetical protein
MVRWAEHVARVRKVRKVYRMLVEKHERKRPPGDVD